MIAAALSSGSRSTAHAGIVSVGLGLVVEGRSKGRGGAGGGFRNLAAAAGGFLEREYLPWPAPSPGGYNYVPVIRNIQLPLTFKKL